GLAGSGALTALVLATLPSTAARLTYMLVFGLGSTLGMAALSGVIGWPLARAGRHHTLARAGSAVGGGASGRRCGAVVGPPGGGIRWAGNWFSDSVHCHGPLHRHVLRRKADTVVAGLQVHRRRDADAAACGLVERHFLRQPERLLKDRHLLVAERHDLGLRI